MIRYSTVPHIFRKAVRNKVVTSPVPASCKSGNIIIAYTGVAMLHTHYRHFLGGLRMIQERGILW